MPKYFYSPSSGEYFEMTPAGPVPVDAAIAETGPLQAFGVGIAHKGLQIGRNVGDFLLGENEERARLRRQEAERFSALQAARPIATGAGEIAPALATAPLSGGYLAQGAIGGLYGLVSEGLAGAAAGAAGGAAGVGIGRLAGRVVNGIRHAARMVGRGVVGEATGELAGTLGREGIEATAGRTVTEATEASGVVGRAGGQLTDEQVQAARAGTRLGMRLTAGQRSGSRPQQLFEASMKSDPLAAEIFEPLRLNNQTILNRSAMKAMGSRAAEPSGEALLQVGDDLGRVFEETAEQIGRADIPGELAERIGAIRRTEPFLELAEAGTEVSGRDLMAIRSRLIKAGAGAWRNGDQIKAEFIDETVDQIDDLAGSQLDEAAQAAWKGARARWKVFRAVQSGQAVTGEGNIAARSLSGALKRVYPSWRVGRRLPGEAGELGEAIRFSLAFPAAVGDSGTATRLSLQNLVHRPARTVGLNLAARGYARFGDVAEPLLGGQATVGGLGRIGGALGTGAGTEYAGSGPVPLIEPAR